jgi:hypothetical protein
MPARRFYLELIATRSNFSDVYFPLGIAEAGLGHLRLAVKPAALKRLSHNPGHPAVLMRSSRALHRHGHTRFTDKLPLNTRRSSRRRSNRSPLCLPYEFA